MKVLIWISCIFTTSIIIVLLGYAGLVLGGIPAALLSFAMIFTAKSLCKKWDHRQKKKAQQPPNPAAEPLTDLSQNVSISRAPTSTKTENEEHGIVPCEQQPTENSASENENTPKQNNLVGKSNKSKIIIACCVVVSVLFAGALCVITGLLSYENGYNEGREFGHEAGYNEGHITGYNDGYLAAHKEDEPSSTFQTVEDLLKAIKNNPYEYSDKTIQVKGTYYKENNKNTVLLSTVGPIVVGSDGSITGEEIRTLYGLRKNGIRIKITIADDILSSVAESDDYMLVMGTVKIANGEIHLDNCTYTMIKAAE